MFKKNIQFIIILLTILLLFLASIYFSYITWQKYSLNSNLKVQLNNTEIIQSFEHSILNEIVCVATMSEHKELMAKVCNKTKKTTDEFMQRIMQQTNDTSLYTLEKVLYDIRSSIKDSGVIAVEKLVNGDLDKKMKKFMELYTSKLKSYSDDISQKESIRLYGQMSDISYATESEKALAAYYLSLSKPIPDKNLIYWGNVVSASDIPEIRNDHVFVLYDKLQKIWQDQKFQKILRSIEDVRMDIMTHASSGNYRSKVAQWVDLVNKKQKILTQVEVLLLNDILDGVNKRIEAEREKLILGVSLAFLSLLAFFSMISYIRHISGQNKLLDDLFHKIHKFSSDDPESKVLEGSRNKKLAYDYIASNYQTLYEKEKTESEENKIKSAFLANLFYEIRTPLDSVLGYTKLLKETSLTIEQSDFVSIVENNSENLNKIVNKITDNHTMYEKKLEINNMEFNFIKKMESIIETFAIKADHKDIVLGVFIDPSLPEKLIGDAIRLSQVLTNLISNALDATSTYGTVDLFIEKMHADNNSVTVKFLVKDTAIELNTEEQKHIVAVFEGAEQSRSIAGIDMQNLNISHKIIKRMGGKIEIESREEDGNSFFFTLKLDKNKSITDNLYPDFKGMKIGLALPSRDVNRQIDKNLEMYIKSLHAEFSIYYHDVLFETNEEIELPDLMLIYHHYARLEGELEAFSKLKCDIALITTGTLRSRVDRDKYNFSHIIYSPITLTKTIKILAKNSLKQARIVEKENQNDKKFENIHALVVEDNVISQKLIKNDLEKFGLKITVVSNGQEAFEMRRENDFDIIFMDIDMPIMDGVETTKKILYYEGINQFKHIPIIALAVNTFDEDEEKYMKIGMDDVITKPFDLNKLEILIQKYCIDLVKEKAETEEDDLIAKVLSGDFLKVEE